MDVTRLDQDPCDADVAAVHALWAAADAVDRPDDPPPLLTEAAASLRLRVSKRRVLRWVVRTPDGLVGYGALRLPDADNTHLGQVQLAVHPAYRRRGIGTALLRAATGELVADGRRLLLGEAWAGTAGERFCRWLGMRMVQEDRTSLLRLADVDWADVERLAAAPHPGYRLVRWRDRCPDELLEPFVVAMTAMNDAPTDDADLEPYAHSAAGVREGEQAARALFDETRLVVAVHEVSGAVAGLTEVQVARDPHRSYQGDTAVVGGHRGSGLGLWLKADMLVRLRAERPDVAELLTNNAASNTHMLRVNDRLGYRPHQASLGFQVEVAALVAPAGARR